MRRREIFLWMAFAEVSVANDADFLYVRFTLHAADGVFTNFNSHLFLDTNDNPGTGFTPGGTSFGSEMMIEGSTGYDQRAGGFNDGPVSGVAWSIADSGMLEYEIRVSRSAIFDSDSQPVFDGDTIRLLLRDNAGDTTASIRYRFAPAPPPPSEYATLTIDGDFSDWAPIPEILSDPSGDGVPDIVSVKAANDSDYLYLTVEYHGTLSLGTYLSIDVDGNPATGFDIFGLGLVGAEASWQNDFPFTSSTGVFNNGLGMSGDYFSIGAALLAPFADGAQMEWAIPLDITLNETSGAVFPDDSISLLFWTDLGTGDVSSAIDYTLALPEPLAMLLGATALPLLLLRRRA